METITKQTKLIWFYISAMTLQVCVNVQFVCRNTRSGSGNVPVRRQMISFCLFFMEMLLVRLGLHDLLFSRIIYGKKA